MKRVLKWLGVAGLCLLLILYVGVQAFQIYFNRNKTEVAVSYVMSSSATTKGLAIRDAQVLRASQEGYFNYSLTDGSKVSGGELISEVYASESDSALVSKARALQRELDMLKESSTLSTSVTDPSALGTQIGKTIAQMEGEFQSGSYAKSADYKNQLLAQISRRQAATGQAVDYTAQMSALQGQIDSLNSQLGGKVSYEYAPASGYFSSAVDGYEEVLTPQALEGMTAAQVQDILDGKSQPAAVEGNPLGKLVKDFDWYVACILPDEKLRWVKEGATLYVEFLGAYNEEVPVVVERITSGEGGKSLVVLRCDYITKDLVNLRIQNIRLSNKQLGGLRVPARALRVENGVKGVYVKDGGTVRFKQVNVLVEEGDYLLVEQVATPEETVKNEETGEETTVRYLELYDEVFVEGKDLYDGKYL